MLARQEAHPVSGGESMAGTGTSGLGEASAEDSSERATGDSFHAGVCGSAGTGGHTRGERCSELIASRGRLPDMAR